MAILWGVIIAGIAFSTIANIFTTSTATPLSQLYVTHWIIAYHTPLFFVIGGLLVLTGISWVGSRESKGTSSLSPDLQSRVIILKTLRKAYTDELTSSLQGMARIALRLHERFNLTHPARLSSWQSGQSERALPDGTTIVDTYDQAGNGLLILGEPGAGKSTLLYDLAQALLSRAEQHEQHPLPVILNLSSWATKRLPLQGWLVEELELRYLIPRTLGRRWQQEGRWLPLLDGLDEVAPSARSACIKEINAYQTTGVVPLVVCSRREAYQAVPEQLTLQSAVIVQPLTAEQVEAYLKDSGRPLAAVRKVVRTNTVLQNLLTTPLMLSVVTLAYKDKAVKDLPQLGTAKQQQQQIFASYILRMLERQLARGQFNPQHTRHWLTWLAQQMQQHQITDFYLERLQPDWLPTIQTQRRFLWLSRLLGGLGVGLVGGLSFGLLTGLRIGPVSGLSIGLLCGLASGLVGGLAFRQASTSIRLIETLSWSWKASRRGLGLGLLGQALGLVVGPVVGRLTKCFHTEFAESPLKNISEVRCQAAGCRDSLRNFSLEAYRPGIGLALGLTFGLVGVLTGLLFGLSAARLDEHLHVTPNQGIQRSGRNALLVGLATGLVV